MSPIQPILRLLTLPDDCIRALLEPLPLWDLFVLRRVCHRFNTIIRLIFRSRHSLKLPRTEPQRAACRHYPARDLFSTRPVQGCSDEDVLLVSDLGPNQVPSDDLEEQTLGSRISRDLLPHIRHLVAFTGYDPHSLRLQLLSDLLPNWSTRLVSLTLIQWDKPGEYVLHRNALNRLLSDALNQMAHLKELHLLSFGYSAIQSADLMAPVLGRLEQFTFQGIYSGTVQPLIRHLGAGIRRLQLGLSHSIEWERSPEECLERCNRTLGHCLTHLSLATTQLNTTTWLNLNGLTHLDLSNVNFLPHLSQIMNPDLFVNLSTSKPALRTLGLPISLLQYYLKEIIAKNQNGIPPVVASVHTLTLYGGYVGSFDHFAPYYPKLGKMFPRVGSISAIHYCSKKSGTPSVKQSGAIRRQIERYFQSHFQPQKVKVEVQFELNRNVLSYYRPNLLFKERRRVS